MAGGGRTLSDRRDARLFDPPMPSDSTDTRMMAKSSRFHPLRRYAWAPKANPSATHRTGRV